MNSLKTHTLWVIIVSLFALNACNDQPDPVAVPDAPEINFSMVELAQQEWIEGLVAVGEAHAQDGDAHEAARQMLNQHYDFGGQGVLFKPTLAHGEQTFRLSKAGALAYFVGGDDNYPDDQGFALQPYVDGTTSVAGVIVHGDIATAMGNITLTNADGGTVTVDKTFVYRLDAAGDLRIVAHHSSLPFSPAQ